MFSSQNYLKRANIDKKRARDSADASGNELDISVWLNQQGDPWMKNLFTVHLIPQLRIYPDSVANPIYKLFMSEPSEIISDDMAKLISFFLKQNASPEYLHDMVAIYQFLRNGDQFIVCLDKLEQAVQAYAATSPHRDKLIQSENGHYSLPPVNLPFHHFNQPRDKTIKPYESTFRILSGYFYQWAREQGFADKVKILNSLPSQTFLSLLSSKSLFKDCAGDSINPLHGMWAHTTQWWCVFKHHEQTDFLQHNPLDVYQQFGRLSGNHWDKIFDASPYTYDFTSPEFVTSTLIDDMSRWPLLSDLTFKQQQKIAFNNGDGSDIYRMHLQKIHGPGRADGFIRRELK